MQLNTIDALATRRARLGREILETTNRMRPLTEQERQRLRLLSREIENAEDDLVAEAHRKSDRAFAAFLKNGAQPSQFSPGVTPEQRGILQARDMTMGNLGGAYPGSTSGFFASLEFTSLVTSALRTYGGVVSTATIMDTVSGTPRPFPSDDDTSAIGELQTEAQQVNQEDIQGISQTVLGSFRFSSKLLKISREFVQDAGVDDFQQYLAGRLGVRLARILNQKFTRGVGTVEPLGLISAAQVGATAVGSATNDGTGAGNVGSDDLANLEASVDPAYRGEARWMMHSNTLAALRKVKDKQGRPLFPGLNSGGENTLLNYGITTNNDMDEPPAHPSSPPVIVKPVAFGKLESYVIRRAPLWAQRLDERFADFGLIAFLLLQRLDGNLLDGGGGSVKTLQITY